MTYLTRRLALIAMTCALAACDTDGSTGPGTPRGPDLASLTVATPTLPADGRAVTVLRAVIPAESRIVPRQVTFSTTAGVLAPGATDSASVTVSADADGVAIALLRASRAPGLAVVRAQAGDAVLQDSVRFVPAAADLASLTLAADSAAADTVTTILVRAVIPRSSTVTPRAVTFTTTLGTFTGGEDTITAEADSTGTASALLRAPATPGVALVTAKAGNTVLQNTVRFYRAPPDLLSLTLRADSLVADGASTMVVRATVRRGTARTPESVTFSTSSGRFGGDTNAVTVRVDSSGTATALLRAPTTPTLAVVRAAAGNASLDTVVRFVRALPDTLVLSADSFRVPAGAGGTLEVTATLRRGVGTVSPGATVHFSAVRPDGTAIGWFAGETVSDSAGVVTARFTPGETDYRGPVRIIATTQQAGGGVVRAEMTVVVTDPG